jgi:uncharacterized membrane protein
MRTPASIFKHPIHPMLIVFPIGLWIFFLACDLIRLAGAPGDEWSAVAFFSMVGGFIGALCAAVPGFIDLLFYKGGAPPGAGHGSKNKSRLIFASRDGPASQSGAVFRCAISWTS